jgi:Type II/IV secretion system protein
VFTRDSYFYPFDSSCCVGTDLRGAFAVYGTSVPTTVPESSTVWMAVLGLLLILGCIGRCLLPPCEGARVLGDEISEEKPLLDSRLPDGSRVAAVFPPCSVIGTILTIRKFHSKRYTADELARIGTLMLPLLNDLRNAVEKRQNILISGGTGTGKTTLLNALASFIADGERIVVIEDTSELQLQMPNLIRLEARREQPGLPAVTIRDLLRATLRLRRIGFSWEKSGAGRRSISCRR